MTFFYRTSSWSSQPQTDQETIKFWEHLSAKANWRIVKLPNGYFQTEYKHINCDCNPEKDLGCKDWVDVTRRETIEAAENAIDASVEHYKKKVEFSQGPVVVKTFK